MKKNRLIIAAIFLLGIGFAAVATTLYVTGTTGITTNDANFDVRFTKAVNAGMDVSLSAISADGKTISIEAQKTNYGILSRVGDVSTLDFEVTNNSELYDAEVSIECTLTGSGSNYLEMTDEVASSIAAKTTEKGKVELKLVKQTLSSISGIFSCTLKATAKERTTKAEPVEPVNYLPKYFAFGDPTTSSVQNYAVLKYPDTDTQAKIFLGLDADEVQKSVCILYNESLECFKYNNVVKERNHMKRVFGESKCSGDWQFSCSNNGFRCESRSDGVIQCYNGSYSCKLDNWGSDAISCS